MGGTRNSVPPTQPGKAHLGAQEPPSLPRSPFPIAYADKVPTAQGDKELFQGGKDSHAPYAAAWKKQPAAVPALGCGQLRRPSGVDSVEDLVWDLSPRAARDPERKAADSAQSAELVLKMERDKPPGLVDHALHMSVLKELLGKELRDMIRDELKTSGADLRAEVGRRPSPRPSIFRQCTVEQAMAGDDVLLPATAASFRGLPPSVVEEAKDAADEPESPEARGVGGHSSMASSTGQGSHVLRMVTGNFFQELVAGVVNSPMMDATTEADELSHRYPHLAHHIMRLDGIFRSIGTATPPPRRDCVSRIAHSYWFGISVTLVLLANCVFLTYVADWQAQNYTRTTPDVVLYIDYAFLAIFTLELFVRLWRYRWYYFFGKNYVPNWIDFIIVIAGVADIATSAVHVELVFVRALRTLRLLKVLRVFRIVRMFKTLRVILASLGGTMADLFWCSVMIVMIQYMFALVFVMRVGAYLVEQSDDLTQNEINDITNVFGSMGAAMLNLFTVSMGGAEWGEHYNLLTPTGFLNQAVYLLFVVFSFVALLNVILGIFVERAMKNLELTKEEKAREHALEEKQVKKDLMALCMEADLDGDGNMSLEEWTKCFSRGKISSYFDLVGLRADDLRAFFELCSSRTDDGQVSIDTFVRGCMRMRGGASSFDVQTAIVELHQLHMRLQEVNEERHRDILAEHQFIREQFNRLASN